MPKFGATWGGNSGFEEWSVPANAQPVQGTASISGTVTRDSNDNHTIDPSDVGFEGIVVNLLDGNNKVIATTHSAGDGTYSFSQLVAGTYSVQIIVPRDSLVVEFPELGVNSGTVDSSWTAVTGIQLNDGDHASGYNFGMWDTGG